MDNNSVPFLLQKIEELIISRSCCNNATRENAIRRSYAQVEKKYFV